MNFLLKLKETITSVLPVMLIVFVLGVTAAPLGAGLLFRFFIGGVLLIAGLAIFLLGVDIGIHPIGEQVGAALTSKKNLALLLTVAFAIGFFVTVAEPDIQVFCAQIHSVFTCVNKMHLIYMIALGVGIFVMLGLMRTMLHISIKVILFILYTVLFSLTIFAPKEFIGIAFDSGGATTGPMTVPFILALGLGVSSVGVRKKTSSEDTSADSFGLTGVTSIGPIIAVIIYGIILFKSGILSGSECGIPIAETEDTMMIFIHILPHILKESLVSIIPLALMFLIFQFTLLHLPPRQFARMSIGLLWSFIGLSIFLIGVNGGFMPTGRQLGLLLGEKAAQIGGIWTFILIATGLLLGAVVVCAEPAVWVLTEQVEAISGGTIKRKFMLIFLSIGAAFAIGLTMWRAVSGFNIMRILLPGYILSIVLMIFSPPLFTSIAFDSGGVASGPITSTFVLSFTMGTSYARGESSDLFGVIALVAMTPLIAIQILGIIYNFKQKKNSNLKKIESANMEVQSV